MCSWARNLGGAKAFSIAETLKLIVRLARCRARVARRPGLASGAGVVGLTLMGLVQPAQLIGASGSIMGIVGAWAGFLMRHRHAPHAKQSLANVLMIVGIQIAFDVSTPQVSMAAHLCGLICGFFLGLILAPRPVAGSMIPAGAD